MGSREGILWMWNMISFTRDIDARSDVLENLSEWRKTHDIEMTYQRFLDQKALYGTPDTVAAKIKWFRDTYNINHMIGDFSAGALEQPKVLRSMELFAEKVMLQLK